MASLQFTFSADQHKASEATVHPERALYVRVVHPWDAVVFRVCWPCPLGNLPPVGVRAVGRYGVIFLVLPARVVLVGGTCQSQALCPIIIKPKHSGLASGHLGFYEVPQTALGHRYLKRPLEVV